MHPFVSLNGRLLEAKNASVLAASSGTLFGKGVFTTLRIRWGKPLLWDKNWSRLASNALTIDVDLNSHSDASTRTSLNEIVQQNRVDAGRARITFLSETSAPIWPFETRRTTSLMITTGDLRPVSNSFKVAISPYTVNSRSPLAGIKSCNYLENVLAMDEAKGRGCDEAVRVNERGSVTSACLANIFWLKDRQLSTPSLTTGCLPGTTREYILENLECREVEAGIEELNSVDAIYLTSAGLGIVSVAEYNGLILQNPPHPITQLLL